MSLGAQGGIVRSLVLRILVISLSGDDFFVHLHHYCVPAHECELDDAPNVTPSSRSAPDSGYVDDTFSRLPSNETVSTYASSDPQDFEIVPEAQIQQIAFTRSQSAPGGGATAMDFSRTRSTDSAPDTEQTPQSARSTRSGKSPRKAKKSALQSAEDAANELLSKGLTTEWTVDREMPICVAEKLAERLNFDEEFAAVMPITPPEGGLFTPKYVQSDFKDFLARRDVLAVNIMVPLSFLTFPPSLSPCQAILLPFGNCNEPTVSF